MAIPGILSKASKMVGSGMHNAIDSLFFTSGAAKAGIAATREPVIHTALKDVSRGLGSMYNARFQAIRKANPTTANRLFQSARGAMPKLGLASMAMTGVGMGLGAYALGSQMNSNKNMFIQNRNLMRDSIQKGGSNREQDFLYNPMTVGSRPRVRAGNLGASGGLTLSLNNLRKSR